MVVHALGGRRLGLSPEDTRRQGRRLLGRLRADVEEAVAGMTASARPPAQGTKADNEPALGTASVVPVAALIKDGLADTGAVAFARHATANALRMPAWVEALLPLPCGRYVAGAVQFHPKPREASKNQGLRVSLPHRFKAVDVDWVPPRRRDARCRISAATG